MTIEGQSTEGKKPLGLKAAAKNASANEFESTAEIAHSQALEEMKKIALPPGADGDELQELVAVFAAAKEAGTPKSLKIQPSRC